MYSTGVTRELVASHHLDMASMEERTEHVHRYRVEVRVTGDRLGEDGYLIDICALQGSLGSVVDHYCGSSLNDQPGLRGAAPTLENLARAIWDSMSGGLDPRRVRYLEIKVWESDDAWAGFGREVGA